MKFAVLRYLVGGFVVVIAALLIADGDIKGAFKGELKASSAALARFSDADLSAGEKGIVYFAQGDFSALTSDTLKVSAAPWVVLTASLSLSAANGDLEQVNPEAVRDIYKSFGFHTPRKFENWPAALANPDLQYPVGQNVGLAKRLLPPTAVTIANIGCPACHSGVVYDESGSPDPDRVWLGAPNTSINLESYSNAIYAALLTYSRDEKQEMLWAAIDKLYPDLAIRERYTLKLIVLPVIRKRIQELEATTGRLLPFKSALPGLTNGLDSLRVKLGLEDQSTVIEHSVFNSIPDLGSRVFRDRFLNTGTYIVPAREAPNITEPADITQERLQALAGIATFVTIPSMGVTPEVAISHIGDMEDVMLWMKDYRPQSYPRPLDNSLLADGQQVYRDHCSACHGSYDESLEVPALLSFPNIYVDVGTDRRRIELTGADIADAINASIYSPYIQGRAASEYTAPPLAGLWSSAPYLHNGSVPTLQTLMYPEARPAKFRVGGHALDLEKVGIAGDFGSDGVWRYPETHQSWMPSEEVDTTAFGLGNQGHEKEFAPLDDGQKRALLEYLKLL